jgi:hypothetical protein
MPNTSAVATNDGTVVEVPDLTVRADRFVNFVEMHRKDYFEEHSLVWCLDEIITRGIAEITRQVKTAQVRREQKAAGDLLKEYNMSPADAAKFLKKALAELHQGEAKPTVVK